MKLTNIPFTVTDWSAIEPTEHKGLEGAAYWRTQHFHDMRVRLTDDTSPHRSATKFGAKLFIVD
ncbi:hypothetical protein [Brevibacillus centrosporus]|uniref:hypothetical protein n=1 Tax=Brevibacillus centrosporus TaxID=54910 RepID=UPI00382C5F01